MLFPLYSMRGRNVRPGAVSSTATGEVVSRVQFVCFFALTSSLLYVMSAIDPPRPLHRRTASSPHYPTRYPSHQMAQPADSPRPRAASRLIHSVKRTLSPAAMAAKRAHSQHPVSIQLSLYPVSNPLARNPACSPPSPSRPRPCHRNSSSSERRIRRPRGRRYSRSQWASTSRAPRTCGHWHRRRTPSPSETLRRIRPTRMSTTTITARPLSPCPHRPHAPP